MEMSTVILEDEAVLFNAVETLLEDVPQKPTPADPVLFAQDELMLLSAVAESKLTSAEDPFPT